MSVCIQCGHQLEVGRFCTNCGHPVGVPADDADWRTGTAERPGVPPAPADPAPTQAIAPPPAAATGPGPRFPMFADEVAPTATTETPVVPAPTPPPNSHRRRRGWLPWLVGAAVLLLVAALGGWLLFGDDDADTVADRPATSQEPGSGSSGKDGEPSPAPGEPTDVSRSATATVPATAPPNQDVDGNLVRYEGRNMLDGVPATAWRMPGDGTGETLTFDLEQATTLTSVGLINGYAKTAREGATTYNWYLGNRRVLAVEWAFDDGTTVSQDLTTTRALQTVDVDRVTTESVQVRLVTVSPPGRGRAARNYTAISEVSLVGTPA